MILTPSQPRMLFLGGNQKKKKKKKKKEIIDDSRFQKYRNYNVSLAFVFYLYPETM